MIKKINSNEHNQNVMVLFVFLFFRFILFFTLVEFLVISWNDIIIKVLYFKFKKVTSNERNEIENNKLKKGTGKNSNLYVY